MTWFPIPNARPSLFPKPSPQLFPNTYAYESRPMVKPTGFREYDARWLFEKEINLMGVQALGLGLARLLKELGVPREIVVGHDFRSYSASIKLALTAGLMAGGAKVSDIGLAITPMAYFAQFALDVAGGGDGDRLAQRQRLDRRQDGRRAAGDVRAGRDGAAARHRHRRRLRPEAGGAYEFVADFPARYIADLTGRPKSPQMKVVAACGNGTAGAFAPKLLARSASRSFRSTAISTLPSRATTRIPKICRCCMRWRKR